MSRSYHVTRRESIRAFAEGDTGPTLSASDKSGIKIKEKLERRLAAAIGHRRTNSAIVSGEKALTRRVLAKRERNAAGKNLGAQ
jgi:hypothetical protein